MSECQVEAFAIHFFFRFFLDEVELSGAGRESVNTYGELIEHYDRLIGERQQKLEQAAEQSAEARWLATIPGIGPYLAW